MRHKLALVMIVIKRHWLWCNFYQKNQITIHKPPYIPDLAPFRIFPKMNIWLEERSWNDVLEEIQTGPQQVLSTLKVTLRGASIHVKIAGIICMLKVSTSMVPVEIMTWDIELVFCEQIPGTYSSYVVVTNDFSFCQTFLNNPFRNCTWFQVL